MVPIVDKIVIVSNIKSDFSSIPYKKPIEKKNIVDAPSVILGKKIFFIFEIILINML